jgi:hypothetical protein
MREQQRVKILRNPFAAQGFFFIADMATIVADRETRVTEAA